MRSARTVLLALAGLAAAIAVAGGVLLTSGGRPPADNGGAPVAETADQTPLGKFIPISPPRPAPATSFTNVGGETVRLADFAGKVVLLNLWATWCAPCRREMPSLERLQTRFGDRLAVLAVSQDLAGNKVVAPFVAKLGLSAIKIYLDPKSTVAKAFRVDGLPTSFIIDRHGLVRGRIDGETDWNGPRMLAAIEPLLGRDDIVKTSSPQAHP